MMPDSRPDHRTLHLTLPLTVIRPLSERAEKEGVSVTRALRDFVMEAFAREVARTAPTNGQRKRRKVSSAAQAAPAAGSAEAEGQQAPDRLPAFLQRPVPTYGAPIPPAPAIEPAEDNQ